MKKLVANKPAYSVIEFDELIQRIINGNAVMVFYRTSNDPDGIPVFLTTSGSKYFFQSPLIDRGRSYESLTLKSTLETAMKSRTIYVLEKDESHQLFKPFGSITG